MSEERECCFWGDSKILLSLSFVVVVVVVVVYFSARVDATVLPSFLFGCN